MILYTPVPMDMVFPVRQPEPVTLERDGRYFTGIRSGSGVQITRLCSTCPIIVRQWITYFPPAGVTDPVFTIC